MVTLKTVSEVDRMRKAGLFVWHALQIARELAKPGMTTGEIDARIERFFDDHHVLPIFKGVPGRVPFPAVTCISVNEEVVHGIPGPKVLKEGDIVGVDTGCKVFDNGVSGLGWCGDAAVTIPVGKISEENQQLLKITEQLLQTAVVELVKASHWSDVARKMENIAKKAGFSVVETLVGHGIGREMHEEPQVPNYVSHETLRYGDFKIRPGLVLAVEPMVNRGVKKVEVLDDHWTIVTKDRKPSAHFEHTLALTKDGVRVLTGPPLSESEKIDISPYVS